MSHVKLAAFIIGGLVVVILGELFIGWVIVSLGADPGWGVPMGAALGGAIVLGSLYAWEVTPPRWGRAVGDWWYERRRARAYLRGPGRYRGAP